MVFHMFCLRSLNIIQKENVVTQEVRLSLYQARRTFRFYTAFRLTLVLCQPQNQ